jgi:hypothetical protein
MWFMQKGVKLSDTLYWLYVIWAENATACSSVFNWIWSFNSGKETTQASAHECYRNTPKNGSIKLSGSYQGDGFNM